MTGMPNSGADQHRSSFEPRHGKGPTGWHIDLKPGHHDRQAVRSQPIGPLNATTNTAAHPETIRRIRHGAQRMQQSHSVTGSTASGQPLMVASGLDFDDRQRRAALRASRGIGGISPVAVAAAWR